MVRHVDSLFQPFFPFGIDHLFSFCFGAGGCSIGDCGDGNGGAGGGSLLLLVFRVACSLLWVLLRVSVMPCFFVLHDFLLFVGQLVLLMVLLF